MCEPETRKPTEQAERPSSKGVPSEEVGRGPGADPYSPPEDDADCELVEKRQRRVVQLAPNIDDTHDEVEEEKPGPRGRKEPPRREPPDMNRTQLPPPVRDVPVPPLPGGQTQP